MTTYPVKEWYTPITDLPLGKKGRWEIKSLQIPKGKGQEMYSCSIGHDYWRAIEDITITKLVETTLWDEYDPRFDPPEYKYSKLTWMSDSPGEYFGQLDLVNRILPEIHPIKGWYKQNVVVGGLGLGLIVHLLKLREDIGKVYVIELEKEIIDLVWDYTKSLWPKGEVLIRHGDFFEELPNIVLNDEYSIDIIIADLWQTNNSEGEEIFKKAKSLMEEISPNTQHLYWLFQEEVEAERRRAT